MGNTYLNEAEMEAIANKIIGMSQEEQIFAAGFIDTDILWDELRKRETRERNFEKAMKDMVMNG